MPIDGSIQSNDNYGIRRRTLLSSIGAVGTVGIAGCAGDDGEYPTQDITFRILGSEGGGTDAYARNIGRAQEEILGVDFAYEPGFAEVIRPITEVHAEDPDGYTMLAANMQPFCNSFMIHEPDFDATDFVPICSVAQTPIACYVNENLGIEDFTDLLERYREGELESVGSQDTHSTVMLHYLREDEEYDWQWNNMVEYGGASPTMQAVAQEEVPVGFTMDGSGHSIIQSEDIEVEALTVMTSERSNILDDTPTVVEEGYPNIDFIAPQNRTQFFPPGTPEDIRDTMAESFEEAIQDDEVQSWSEDSGFPVEYLPPEETEEAVEDYMNEISEAVDMDEI